MTPVCAFRFNNQWHWGTQPKATLCLSIEQLANLDSLMKKHQAQWACGVLPYEANFAAYNLPPSQPNHIIVMLFDQLETAEQLPSDNSHFALTSPFANEQSQADYLSRFNRVINYLKAGDCYQVNLAMRFNARFTGSTYSAWLRLLAKHPAPHACYFQTDGRHLFSVSPESFLEIDKSLVRTAPIKGSQPRGQTPEEDQALGNQLLNSSKDRAENLMIVDLLRNDLGAICEAGSIAANPLFELQRFSNVQHLVSTVTGKLRQNITPIEALISCFPGGSITGAPKKRAMEIINELEPSPRHAYCGSFFALNNQQQLYANILIRSFQATPDGELSCHGGGGITIASEGLAEYDECHFKVNNLMASLESTHS